MITDTTNRQDQELAEYLEAKRALTVDLTIDASAILQWVRDTFGPEDVFSDETLERWATSFGYVW